MPTTLFVSPGSEKLTKWSKLSSSSEDKIYQLDIGEPLTVEFRRVNIASNKFDYFGKSKVMLTTYTKSKHVKEASIATINYYDDDVKPKNIGKGKKKFTLGPFDASEYGDPVIYHTPAYLGDTITITTKFWEIDDPNIAKKTFDLIEYGLSLATPLISSLNPMAKPYFDMANAGLGLSSRVICGAIDHDRLAPEHTIEFRLDSSKPLKPGKYICLPEVEDLNEKYDIIRRYSLVENRLVECVMDDGEGVYHYNEYLGTYFVLKLTNKEREDLVDFDFAASAAELMTMFREGSQTYMDALLTKTKDAHDFARLQEFLEEVGTNEIQAKALLKHLPVKIQKLVEPLIPEEKKEKIEISIQEK